MYREMEGSIADLPSTLVLLSLCHRRAIPLPSTAFLQTLAAALSYSLETLEIATNDWRPLKPMKRIKNLILAGPGLNKYVLGGVALEQSLALQDKFNPPTVGLHLATKSDSADWEKYRTLFYVLASEEDWDGVEKIVAEGFDPWSSANTWNKTSVFQSFYDLATGSVVVDIDFAWALLKGLERQYQATGVNPYAGSFKTEHELFAEVICVRFSGEESQYDELFKYAFGFHWKLAREHSTVQELLCSRFLNRQWPIMHRIVGNYWAKVDTALHRIHLMKQHPELALEVRPDIPNDTGCPILHSCTHQHSVPIIQSVFPDAISTWRNPCCVGGSAFDCGYRSSVYTQHLTGELALALSDADFVDACATIDDFTAHLVFASANRVKGLLANIVRLVPKSFWKVLYDGLLQNRRVELVSPDLETIGDYVRGSATK